MSVANHTYFSYVLQGKWAQIRWKSACREHGEVCLLTCGWVSAPRELKWTFEIDAVYIGRTQSRLSSYNSFSIALVAVLAIWSYGSVKSDWSNRGEFCLINPSFNFGTVLMFGASGVRARCRFHHWFHMLDWIANEHWAVRHKTSKWLKQDVLVQRRNESFSKFKPCFERIIHRLAFIDCESISLIQRWWKTDDHGRTATRKCSFEKRSRSKRNETELKHEKYQNVLEPRT